MRPVRALVMYIAVVLVVGALLAPWLYWLAQSLTSVFPKLADEPFHRFVNRSLLGLALLGLWPLLSSLGATSCRELGLVSPSGHWWKLAGGFGLGFLSLAGVAGLALLAGARQWNANLTAGRWVEKTLAAVATAVLVAVVEEVLFRGGLFGALRKASRWTTALVCSSAVYALVHLLASARLAGEVTWWSGLGLLPRMLHGLLDGQQLMPGFLCLTLAGAWLALAYQRTGNLYFSIGLHAGWVFWLKFHGFATSTVVEANEWLWGSHKLINGWLAFGVLAAGLAALARVTAPQRTPAPP
jgi:membrane protease YdiL (CAAX protease family)